MRYLLNLIFGVENIVNKMTKKYTDR